MNSREISTLKQKIYLHISKRELKDTFEALAKLISTAQNWQLADKLNELESNYKYMLQYVFEGTKDSQRDAVYNGIIRSLYELVDDVSDDLLLPQSTNYFYERWRINNLNTTNFVALCNELKELSSSLSLSTLMDEGEEKHNKKRELSVQRERLGINLFNHVYISKRAVQSIYEEYKNFMTDEDILNREKCLFISAIALNVFHRFDPLKVKILLEAIDSPVAQIRARAIVSTVLAVQIYDQRWHLYPELQKILDSHSENADFQKAILKVIVQLIRSRDTEKISKKMTEEIIPQMMKFSKLTGKRLDMEDLMGETDFMDKNPDWQKELEDSGLGKKLQEYSELQMEGADVFHSTFANLKSFPFFSEISNWFIPFDYNHSEINELFPNEEKDSLLKLAIVDSGHMCNSDKYSFCLSLKQIPTAQRDLMMNRMGAESEQIKELQKDAQTLNPKIDEEILSNQYIQDLYRFYKLNARKNDFLDIFKLDLDFCSKSAFSTMLSDINSMTQIANYCFDKNHFDVALNIYRKMINIENQSDSIWQKTGFCLQAQHKDKEALEAYLKADLINPNKSWTIRKIGQLYRTLGQPKQALSYFEKAAQLTPSNMNIQLNIGHCYLEMKDYENALNTYFKVELSENGSDRAYRPIAWTSFLLKKYDTAEKYYDKIINSTPTLHDYLNAGHVQLALNNLKKSLEYYTHAANMAKDMEEFTSLIMADKEILIEYGVDKEFFSYLLDQIRYLLN